MKLWDEELEGYREETRNLLQFLPDLGADDPPADKIERALRMREAIRRITTAPPSERAETGTVPGPAGDVPVRIFRPAGRARALFLHIHGGGFVLGDPTMNDPANEALARDHGLAVVSVDYRLAPEHPHPAGPDDCQAAAAWLLEKGPTEFGAERVLIGGESAGGHLALLTALRARDRLGAVDRLLGLNLVFGLFDLNGTPSQRGNGGRRDLLDPEGLAFFRDCFTPGMGFAERCAPDVSPLGADLAGLPRSLVSVGTGDHLLDDSLLLGGRLAAAGVEVELAVYPDAPHGFTLLPGKMAAAFQRRLDGWLEQTLTGAGL